MKLLEAINEENLLLIKEILAKDPTAIDMLNNEGIPLSFVAAQIGNLDIVKFIVEYSRESMDRVTDNNSTILHFAAMSGNTELAKYLVEKVGMSITSPNIDLVTPFEIARLMNHKELENYFASKCGVNLDGMYKNPIRVGMFPDPSIVRVDEDYYMVNSSFIYFPCIPISHSKDLIHWKIIGYAITNPEWANLDELEGGRGYWAPDISYYKNKFYITATYRMNDGGPIYRKQIVVSSFTPEGPYSKPAFIDEDGIDPSIFNDEDGRRYMLLNRGARILELSEDGSRQISEASLLYYGDHKRAPEGPHLIKKDGYYYLFLAEGGTGPKHRITVARSRTLQGDFEPCPYNPIMTQKDEHAGLQRCGHGKPVMTQKGQWYMVYLCGRMIGDGYSILGRETALDPIEWTIDGWPLVNNLKGPSALQKKPDLAEHIWDNKDQDDFNTSSLDPEWMFPRPPDNDGYSLRQNKLYLSGSQAPMESKEARNIVLRRQKHFVFTAETKMELVEMKDGQEAGVTCYYDENTWLKFAVFANLQGDLLLKTVEHIDKVDRTTQRPLIIDKSKKAIYLQIKTNYLRRECYYSYDGLDYHLLDCLENVYYLCDEGISKGKRFTGAMLGMYVYSGKNRLEVPFEYFHYSPNL